MDYQAIELPKGSGNYLFASVQDQSPWPSCKDHAPDKHKSREEAHFCFYDYEMQGSQEADQGTAIFDSCSKEGVPDGGKITRPNFLSDCQMHPCKNRTTKVLVNAVVPSGRFLCDVHRNKTVMMSLAPFIGNGSYYATTAV